MPTLHIVHEEPIVPESNSSQISMQPNAENRYEVTRQDLPLHCPMPGMSLWNSHPRVFIPVAEAGCARCPYCSAEYVLID